MRLSVFDIEEAKAGKTVVTRDGREAKYIKPHSETSSVYVIDGRKYVINDTGMAVNDIIESKYDLFIASDETGPALFEDKLRKILIEDKAGKYDNIPVKDRIRNFSNELLDTIKDEAEKTNDSDTIKTNVAWRIAEDNVVMENNVIVIRNNGEGQKSMSLVKKVKEGEYYLTLDDLEKIQK